MSNKKLQEKKRKARERKSKEKVLKKRAQIRAKAKHEREVARVEHKHRNRQQPYMKRETRERITAEKDEQVKQQLERNMDILKALEEEYAKEMVQKAELNAELEADGHSTLQEKLDTIAAREAVTLEAQAKMAEDEEEKTGDDPK
jgi:hypothetical protein